MPQQSISTGFDGHWLEDYNTPNAWFEALDDLLRNSYGQNVRITVRFDGTIDGSIPGIESDNVEVYVEGEMDTYTEPFTGTFRLEVGGLSIPFLNVRVTGSPTNTGGGPPSETPDNQ